MFLPPTLLRNTLGRRAHTYTQRACRRQTHTHPSLEQAAEHHWGHFARNDVTCVPLRFHVSRWCTTVHLRAKSLPSPPNDRVRLNECLQSKAFTGLTYKEAEVSQLKVAALQWNSMRPRWIPPSFWKRLPLPMYYRKQSAFCAIPVPVILILWKDASKLVQKRDAQAATMNRYSLCTLHKGLTFL